MGSMAHDSSIATLRDEERNRRQLKMELRKIPDEDAEDRAMHQDDIKSSEERIAALKKRISSMEKKAME